MTTIENLTCRNIRDIVRACRENQVSKLQFGDLSIEFNYQSKEELQSIPVPMEMVVERNEESLEERAAKKKLEFEDLLEEARLANPSLYEDLIQIEEIADAGNAKAENDQGFERSMERI